MHQTNEGPKKSVQICVPSSKTQKILPMSRAGIYVTCSDWETVTQASGSDLVRYRMDSVPALEHLTWGCL